MAALPDNLLRDQLRDRRRRLQPVSLAGMMERASRVFRESTVPGGSLILYTDGVFEMRNPVGEDDIAVLALRRTF